MLPVHTNKTVFTGGILRTAGTLRAATSRRTTAVEFADHSPTWSRLRAQGVLSAEDPPGELRVDLDESTPVVTFDIAAHDHPHSGTLPAAIVRVPRGEIGPIVEGIVHKLRLPETAVVPVGTWRRVFEAVAKPMSVHEQWRAIDAAATVELNTRDPLVFGPAHHHLLRDLVNAVIEGEAPDQGISVVALGVRVVIEVSPGGQLIVFAGDEHLAAPVRGVIEHHLRPR